MNNFASFNVTSVCWKKKEWSQRRVFGIPASCTYAYNTHVYVYLCVIFYRYVYVRVWVSDHLSRKLYRISLKQHIQAKCVRYREIIMTIEQNRITKTPGLPLYSIILRSVVKLNTFRSSLFLNQKEESGSSIVAETDLFSIALARENSLRTYLQAAIYVLKV